ncbi:MAG: hypothetical protein CL908_24075 [Deltaproteobacteria bacterium]|nr:hypothetical protein [Deltaproteobacteria bacterium]
MSETNLSGWFALASSAAVARRALAYMIVVGSILIAINHGDAILRWNIDGTRLFKMLLTPLVPYVVSTLSSVSAIRATAGDRSGNDPSSRLGS